MNLANLPPDHRAEIDRDKQRWYRALRMLRTMRPPQIRDWLATLDDESDRDDWRYRLNTIKNRRKRG